MGKSKHARVIPQTDTKGVLQAGAAMVDITPKAGTHLAGSGMGDRRPAQSGWIHSMPGRRSFNQGRIKYPNYSSQAIFIKKSAGKGDKVIKGIWRY